MRNVVLSLAAIPNNLSPAHQMQYIFTYIVFLIQHILH